MPRLSKRPARQAASDDDQPPRIQRRRPSPDADEISFAEDAEPTQGDTSLEQMVKNMVRLALASEYSRTPIRRQDISTKVLGTQSRQFKAVFNAAQLQLRAVFGMEMTEMPIAEKVTVAQRRAAAKSGNTQKSSGAWQLVSTLPERFHTPAILAPPQVPTTEEESQYTALYTVIVALIALSGGNLSETKLERYMRRFNLDEYTPFVNSNAFSEFDKPERLLRRMEKDKYIIKVKDNSGGEELVEYLVGPRAKTEIGDSGVAGLVRTVFEGQGDPAELDRQLERSLGVNERKTQAATQNERKRGRPTREEGDGEEAEDQDSDDG